MTTPNPIYLRPSLDFDPTTPTNRYNLVAYSPDILPLYKTKITDPDQLTSTYESFVAQTVVPEEQNYIYVRGAATDPKTKATTNVVIGSVTNELILWPQVLNAATKIGTTTLTYTPGTQPDGTTTPAGVTASIKALTLTPPGRGGRHDTFISVTDGSLGKLPDASNYQDLLDTVGSVSAISLLNAVVADPVFDVYSLSTRLRWFDDGTTPINVELDVEAMGIPSGFFVSIFSDDPDILLAKTPVDTTQRIGFTFPAKNGLDVSITVQLYKGTSSIIPPDNSSISLVASVNKAAGHGVVENIVIGAEHVVFDSAIRISRALVQGQLGASSGPLLGSTVQGFYFRDKIGDTDQFPRSGVASHSPDIQPLGTLPVSGIDQVLSPATYGTDVTDQKGTGSLVPGSSNYIYLRGAANAATHIELSLYAIPSALLITPSQYSSNGIMEMDINNNPTLAVRELNITTPGDYTVDTPFNFANPPPVPAGSDHYCMIAEWRLWAQDPIDKPFWPHQMPLPTGSDVVNWILSNPAVAWRNMSWSSNPDAPTEIWQVNFAVDDTWMSTDQGYLTLVCQSMPTGGQMQFSATKTAGGTVLDIGKTDISNPSQIGGVHFTGLQGPWDTTITISWWQGTGQPRPGGSALQMQIQKVIGGSSMLAVSLGNRVQKVSDEQANWPTVVGPDYPNLERRNLTGHAGPKRKRPLLLGGAHPLPQYPAPGKYDHSKGGARVGVRPTTVAVLGGDTKAIPPGKTLQITPPTHTGGYLPIPPSPNGPPRSPSPTPSAISHRGHHHHHHHCRHCGSD